ncbi:MAG: EscU/YscU/HrcU family type III secretion system export apparatus switch protein [Proteobacteria bacterium]|nr:EscU/YscU/HrcU family type III secretion system export apparatus switch protein [Pseudomonadota bacterium]
MSKERKSSSKLRAAALKYNAGEDASPKMVAKGRGLMAERIIELAKECGVPVHEDSELVEVLSALELNEDIPADLYKAVAEVLAFIYKLQKSA